MTLATTQQPEPPFALATVPQGETASHAMAQQAKALVEARYLVAINRPRNMDKVRQDLLAACRRKSFACNKSVFYVKPIGNGITGLGIRFVEEAFRHMTNILTETMTVYEDEDERIVRVTITDLESNTLYSKDVTITKTVERSKIQDGQEALAHRKNSYGKDVFTVRATDDDLLNKEGALVSKAIRTNGLRLIPSDLREECESEILRIRVAEADEDPTGTRKRMVDAFAEFGVKAEMLVAYLGHPLDQMTTDELVQMRGLHGAIADGETTWAAAMENRKAGNQPPPKPPEGTGPGAKAKEAAKQAAGSTATTPQEREESVDPPAPETVWTPLDVDLYERVDRKGGKFSHWRIVLKDETELRSEVESHASDLDAARQGVPTDAVIEQREGKPSLVVRLSERKAQ